MAKLFSVKIAMENDLQMIYDDFYLYLPIKSYWNMVTFHSYVMLRQRTPDGKMANIKGDPPGHHLRLWTDVDGC